MLSLLGDASSRCGCRSSAAAPRRRPRRTRASGARTVDLVMRHRVIAVVVSVAVLLIAAIPYFDMNSGAAGPLHAAGQTLAKQGYVVLNRDFTVGQVTPATIVVDGDVATPAAAPGVPRLRAELAQDDRFGPSQPAVAPGRNLAVITVPVAGDPNSDAALNAVRDLRARYLRRPRRHRAAGLGHRGQRTELDYFDITDKYLPIVFALVLGLSFILLMLAFRSIVVPASSIVMNLLSVGAAYGLLVLVTQKGHGAGLFGFQAVPTVEAWIPLFLFSVLFGLSMDYHVFLLSRIREHYDLRGDNREAVAYGFTRLPG